MDKQGLINFLIAANQAGYAGGDEKKWIKEPDGSTTIPFQKGKWRSNDNFFGGEPYGGRTIVFYENKPVWIMVYYGWVIEGIEVDPIYAVLRKALMQMPTDYPYRGPAEFQEGTYTYINSWQGEVDTFTGEEHITEHGRLVYQANYLGGWLDQRRGV